MTWKWDGSKSSGELHDEKVVYALGGIGGIDKRLPALVALHTRYGDELHSVALSPEEMDDLCRSWLVHRGWTALKPFPEGTANERLQRD